MELHSVDSVQAMAEAGRYIVQCNITDAHGETYDCPYVSYPDDPYGLNPTIRQWLVDHVGEYEIIPYVAPAPLTPEELRVWMLPITARQLRLILIRNGISLAAIRAAIDSLPDSQAKDEADIEWEYASSYTRTHPLISTIGAAVGLTEEQIDIMWSIAGNT